MYLDLEIKLDRKHFMFMWVKGGYFYAERRRAIHIFFRRKHIKYAKADYHEHGEVLRWFGPILYHEDWNSW